MYMQFAINVRQILWNNFKEEKIMMLTKENLSEVVYENEDARLLIQDVITHTSATLYYYADTEITVVNAIKIWNRAMRAEKEYGRRCSISFIDSPKSVKEALCS